MGVITKYINKRIKRNQNFIGVIIGATGSGKSYSCMGIAETYKREERKSAKIYIIFHIKELLELLTGNQLKKGDFIIFEELGISADKRRFWSIMNKVIRYVAQTFRSLNVALLINVPVLDFIDKDVRALIHVLLETKRIDYENEKVICKFFVANINHKSGDVYFKYPMVYVHKMRKWVKCKSVAVPKPSEEMIKSYEERKSQFNMGLYEDLLKEVVMSEKKIEKKNKPEEDLNELAKKVIENIDDYKNYRGRITVSSLQAKLQLSNVKARQLRDLVLLGLMKRNMKE